jgi:hypothetical protein
MDAVPISLSESFFQLQSSPLQFDLYKWKSIDQNHDIIAILVFALHGHLLGYLKLVLTPVDLVDQFDGAMFSVIIQVRDTISENLSSFKDVPLVDEIQNLLEISIAEFDFILFFQLRFEIQKQVSFPLDDNLLVT